jgi:hypothetical protein
MAKGLNTAATRDGPVIDRSLPLPGEELSAWLDADEDDAAPHNPPHSKDHTRGANEAAPEVINLPAEPVLRRLLGGEHKAQFLLLADWFESAVARRPADVCVEADFGDVFFEVIDWIETPGFLKLVVDSKRMQVRPTSMSKLRIRRRDEVFLTTCVSPVTPMFGQLPFAELLLVVEGKETTNSTTQTNMEKNARTTLGITPSAVSGKPSTDIDNEEPVAYGEKAASVRGALAPRDFDVSRETEED